MSFRGKKLQLETLSLYDVLRGLSRSKRRRDARLQTLSPKVLHKNARIIIEFCDFHIVWRVATDFMVDWLEIRTLQLLFVLNEPFRLHVRPVRVNRPLCLVRRRRRICAQFFPPHDDDRSIHEDGAFVEKTTRNNRSHRCSGKRYL